MQAIKIPKTMHARTPPNFFHGDLVCFVVARPPMCHLGRDCKVMSYAQALTLHETIVNASHLVRNYTRCSFMGYRWLIVAAVTLLRVDAWSSSTECSHSQKWREWRVRPVQQQGYLRYERSSNGEAPTSRLFAHLACGSPKAFNVMLVAASLST